MKQINFFLKITTALCLLFVVSCTPEEETPDSADPRDKYVGTWSCAEKSQLYFDYSYQANISKSTTNSTDIIIENFYNLGFQTSVVATLNGASFEILQQTVSAQVISGSGSSSGSNVINFSYTADDLGGTPDNVTVKFTK